MAAVHSGPEKPQISFCDWFLIRFCHCVFRNILLLPIFLAGLLYSGTALCGGAAHGLSSKGMKNPLYSKTGQDEGMLRWNQLKSCFWPFKSQKEIKENISNGKKKIFIWKAKRQTKEVKKHVHFQNTWKATLNTHIYSVSGSGVESSLQLELCFLEDLETSWWGLAGRNRPWGGHLQELYLTVALSCLPTVKTLTELQGSVFLSRPSTENFTVRSHVTNLQQSSELLYQSLLPVTVQTPCSTAQSQVTSLVFLRSPHFSS